MKVVINGKVGGFTLAYAAALRAQELGATWAQRIYDSSEEWADDDDCPEVAIILDTYDGSAYLPCQDKPWFRRDPVLVQVVEELGALASPRSGSLFVVEVPDGVEFTIEGCESGVEWVAEVHRRWGADGPGHQPVADHDAAVDAARATFEAAVRARYEAETVGKCWPEWDVLSVEAQRQWGKTPHPKAEALF